MEYPLLSSFLEKKSATLSGPHDELDFWKLAWLWICDPTLSTGLETLDCKTINQKEKFSKQKTLYHRELVRKVHDPHMLNNVPPNGIDRGIWRTHKAD
jgi:hypothetical protein